MASDTSDCTGADRRGFARHNVTGQAKVEPLDSSQPGEQQEAQIQDISRMGVRFCVNSTQPMVNSMWRIRFFDQGHEIGSVPVLIRYCRAKGEQSCEVGGQVLNEPRLINALGVEWSALKVDAQLCGQDASIDESGHKAA